MIPPGFGGRLSPAAFPFGSIADSMFKHKFQPLLVFSAFACYFAHSTGIKLMKSNLSHAGKVSLLFICLGLFVARGDDFQAEPGYISLFNGKDLTGWGYRTNNFDGKTQSDDGRYSAADGILTVHPHSPRLEQTLWTTRDFPKDFTLKFEFRAEVNAQTTASSSRLPRGRALQGSQEIQAPGLERS
jgi:hypothetical protein